MPSESGRGDSRAITSLRAYPRQSEIFRNLSDVELRLLAEDIDRRGLLEPVSILPDGTIVSGHQRVRACDMLGWTSVPVLVHHELAANPEEAERFFLNANLTRRHSGPIALARVYKALRESYMNSRDIGDNRAKLLRDAIAEQISAVHRCSGRNLDRYLRLLQLPRAVQDAIEQKRLSADDGAKILSLPKAQQQRVADACAAGRAKVELQKIVRGTVPDMTMRRFRAEFLRSIFSLCKYRKPSGTDRRAEALRLSKEELDLVKGVIKILRELSRLC